MSKWFDSAQGAFEYYYDLIRSQGLEKSDSKFLNNVGFYIRHSFDNLIRTEFRKWNKKYADREYQWYLSENRSVVELKKFAPIWDKMHNGDNIVNSNYGYQWNRNEQLKFIIDELNLNNESRRAVITIYDGKEHAQHKYDTPCTLNIIFSIYDNKLNMSVLMRSNDLWYGFCNDQYCFSLLHRDVGKCLNIELGWYYHFANDLHIYKDKL